MEKYVSKPGASDRQFVLVSQDTVFNYITDRPCLFCPLPEQHVFYLLYDSVWTKDVVTQATIGTCKNYFAGRPNFEKFDGFGVTQSGECGQIVDTSLFYTPTIDANGTLLKCLVNSNTTNPTVDLAVVKEIRILPSKWFVLY